MLQNTSLSTTCSKHAGWLKKEFIDDIRTVMYEYLEKAWQKYLIGELPSCGNEHSKLYSDYMEEDNLDYTRQIITKQLEETIDEDNQNEDEHDELVLDNDVIRVQYQEWTTLDLEELAKLIFSDNRVKTELSNSNPCSDDDDDLDYKLDNLDI